MLRIEKPLKSEDVAMMYDVSIQTVSDWVLKGLIPNDIVFRTPGGRIRFHREAMENFFKKSQEEEE